MVVCKFYLSGRCKFGDRCRNEHPRNISDFSSNSGSFSSQSNWQQGGGSSNTAWGGGGGKYNSQGYQQNNNQGGGFGQSFGNQNRFAALGDDFQRSNRGPASGAADLGGGNAEPKPGEILESIKRDAEEWDASGMWPYSSYRPTRAQGDIPGLQDVSPEELRLEAYLAEKENRFEEYKGAVSTSASMLQKKREMLKKPSAELQKALISVYRVQYKSGSFGGKSIFGVQDMSSTEIFSKSGSSLFQSSTNPSSSPPTGLFSTSATNGAFGKTTLGSGFGSNTATPSTVPQGLFSAPSGTTSSFGSLSSQSSGFGSGGGTGFGTSGGAGFGTSGSGLFGKPAEPQAPTGLFGKPAQTGTGLFGKPATQGSGLFGKGEPQGTGLFGKPALSDSPSVNSKCFTLLSELTPEEKEQFEAPTFTLGKIPTRPPPMEMVKAVA